jgi:hypothetical protein
VAYGVFLDGVLDMRALRLAVLSAVAGAGAV